LGARALARHVAELEDSCVGGASARRLCVQDCDILLALGTACVPALTAALAPSPPPRADAPPVIDDGRWGQMLAETLALLRAADMQAVDAAQALLAAAPAHRQDLLRTVLAHSERLDFAVAADLLDALAQQPQPG